MTGTRSFFLGSGLLLLLVAGSLAVIPVRGPSFVLLLVAAVFFAALFGFSLRARIGTQPGLFECTAEVGAALTAGGTMQQGLERCANAVVRHVKDATVQIWSLNEATNTFELEAQADTRAVVNADGQGVSVAEHEIWRVAKRGTPYLFNYGQKRADLEDAQWATREGIDAFAGHPLIADNKVIGVLAAFGSASLSKNVLEAFGAVSVPIAQFVARKRAEEQLSIDITDRARLEEQQRQSQKMEAVGLLAAGVAHDFNNLLTAIIGFSELALEQLDADSPVRPDVQEILKAGRSATGLTRQLLAFSRRQVLEPQILDLNSVIDRADSLLRRLIGEDIEVVLIKHPELDSVNADPGQLEQVIINLVINARDAMPEGGRVTIETANVELDESYVSTHPDASAGRNVLFSVSDIGTGMDGQVLAHLFEPFFTTKEKMTASGLGLATVQGIVRQSNGSMEVSSELGQGTTFRIYLPSVSGRA